MVKRGMTGAILTCFQNTVSKSVGSEISEDESIGICSKNAYILLYEKALNLNINHPWHRIIFFVRKQNFQYKRFKSLKKR